MTPPIFTLALTFCTLCTLLPARGVLGQTPHKGPQGTRSAARVGWVKVPSRPSEDEVKLLSAALSLHRKGHYAESEMALAKLARGNPGFSRARYNWACALSRLMRYSEAAALLAPLLEEDLPHYRSMLAEAPDLAGLRASPAMATLSSRIGELALSWKAGSKGGIPMVMWAGKVAQPNSFFRGGVWNPSSGRFVPLGRKARHTLGAIVDIPNQRVVTASRVKLRHWDYPLHDFYQVEVHPLFGEGPAVFSHKPAIATEIEAFPVPDGVHLRWLTDSDGASYFKHTLWKHRKGKQRPLKGPHGMETGQGTKLRIPRLPPRSTLYVSLGAAYLRDPGHTNFPHRNRYTWKSGERSNYSFSGNRLRRKGVSYQLSPGHRGDLQTVNNLVLGPDKNFAWVVSNQARKCRFVVDRINLKTGKTSLLKRGKGRAYARVHNGGLYLQVGEETRAFQRFDQPWEEGTPLPMGVGFLHPECGFR